MPPKKSPDPEPVAATEAEAQSLLDGLRSETAGKGVWAKIAAVQHHVVNVEKTGRVSFGSTKFSHMQEHGLISVLRPLCRAVGLAYTFGMVPGGWRVEGNSFILECKLTVVDIETGELVVEHFANVGVDNADKGFNKAYTGAMKYALQKFFAVPTEDIDDNEATEIARESAGRAQGAPSTGLADATTVAKLRKELGESGINPDKVVNHLTAEFGVSTVAALKATDVPAFSKWVADEIASGA